jgi:hypothetical protein
LTADGPSPSRRHFPPKLYKTGLYRSRIAIPHVLSRCSRVTWIDAEEVVAQVTGVHMEVQVRDFLKGSLANRVPDAHALAREGGAHSPCNAREHRHDGSACGRIELAHVVNVLPGNDENVPRMELSKIYERNGLLVFTNDARRLGASNYSAEDALVMHCPCRRYSHTLAP